MFRLLAALTLAAAPIVQAADLVMVPPDVAAKQQELLPLIPASAQPKIVYAARSLAVPIMQGTVNEQSANPAVIAAFGDMDIDAIVAVVMLEAAKDAQADLKQLLDEMNKLNEQKRKLREYTDTLIARRAAMSKDAAAEYRARTSVPAVQKTPFLQLEYARYEPLTPVDPSRLTLAELDVLIADSQAELDSMGKSGERISMMLQMAMDRVSKFMTMVSNIMKKVNDDASSIIRNLK
jgi:hypothetical protein